MGFQASRAMCARNEETENPSTQAGSIQGPRSVDNEADARPEDEPGSEGLGFRAYGPKSTLRNAWLPLCKITIEKSHLDPKLLDP